MTSKTSKFSLPEISDLKKLSFQELLQEDYRKKLLKKNQLFHNLKRLLEVIFSILIIILLSPIWMLLVILIRLNSKGKAIFTHKRVGQNGQQFNLYKFRTMYQGVKDQEFAPTTHDDPRITKVGKFLRKTSLDEVPQFWNVIKGDMSLIGPRPEMPFIVAEYTDLERTRLMLRPGLTGLWQIKGRKDLPLHENVEFDLYYIVNQSFWLDLIILLRTIMVVMKGKGAY